MNSIINNQTTVTTTHSSTNNQNKLNILDPTTSEYHDFNWSIEQTYAWAARFLPMEDLQKFKEANFNGEALSSLQSDDLNSKVKISFGQSILLFQRISKGIALSQPTTSPGSKENIGTLISLFKEFIVQHRKDISVVKSSLTSEKSIISYSKVGEEAWSKVKEATGITIIENHNIKIKETTQSKAIPPYQWTNESELNQIASCIEYLNDNFPLQKLRYIDVHAKETFLYINGQNLERLPCGFKGTTDVVVFQN
ncbi:hypothetical protein DLAC_05849 [Tieghemostelium lacteum]|uniref:SAM domain-containing protein n=1 Tax=Tieghemostelium lacteum TaxID=361077 RepID=A0A151ZGV7_TIELA|nr:hypothetical protein DLAC_05849 [Tieghemostelium lacteum]|eukprot:KYQ93211.1 hypothetical protein DLAC_05849 [Tieghemostelium lacteum]